MFSAKKLKSNTIKLIKMPNNP